MKKRLGSSNERRNLLVGLAFISPWIIGFLWFSLYPIVNSLYYSFTNYNGLREPEFVGATNYVRLFTDDPLFSTSMKNTTYMTVVGLIVIISVTFIVSVIVSDKRLKGVSQVKALFFMPTLVPMVALCILWYWMLDGESGVINGVLSIFGVQGPKWLADPAWAKNGIIMMNLWCSGNMIIIFLAGLQDVPASLYEAVDIDGGNFLHKFRYITIPYMMPIIAYNAVTAMIRFLQQFAESFIMTEGGPNNSTLFFGVHLYNNAFKNNRMGYASAMAWVMLIIAMILTFLMLKATKFGKEN